MRELRFFSLTLACLVAVAAAGCDGGSSGGTAGSGGTGGSGGMTSSGGTGGSGGAMTGGGGMTSTGGSGGTGGMSAGMTLTVVDVAEGGMIPVEYTCAGKNISPQLDWTPGPAGTLSYAVVFEDETNGLIHSAIFDIPAAATGLPVNVEKTKSPANVSGAQQALAYDQQTYGYLGPCPGGTLHTYRFTVYALDVATLPIAGIPSKESVKELSLEHDLASASVSAQSDAAP